MATLIMKISNFGNVEKTGTYIQHNTNDFSFDSEKQKLHLYMDIVDLITNIYSIYLIK